MQEERVFPSESLSESSSQNSQHGQETDDEFFDPMPHGDDDDDALRSHKEITHSRKKALLEFRCRVEDAIQSNYLFGKNKQYKEDLKDVSIYGVPLLPSKGDEGTDIVLLKFLKAKDYRVSEAFHMLRKTMKWRKELEIDELLSREFSPCLQEMWNVQGRDNEGRPICYFLLGAMKDKELRKRFLGSDEKCQEFMRWRFQCVERGVREILFREGSVSSVIQVTDLQNAPAPAMRGVHGINQKMMSLIHEHYPGLLFKNIFINVPVSYMAYNVLNLHHMTHRTKKKHLFVRSANITKTLLKFMAPENIPVQYGGLRRENDTEFSTDDKVLEASVKANATTRIQIPVEEVGVTMTWDVMVGGNEVTYKEEFVPSDDCSYKILLRKEKKMHETVRNSFYIREPGNIVITIENGAFKKRKAFYRHKRIQCVPVYHHQFLR